VAVLRQERRVSAISASESRSIERRARRAAEREAAADWGDDESDQ
jgi:hypothetical protein